MQYEIKGGAFPVVICQLNDGEQMITEKGSMVWMSPNMEMKTSGRGMAFAEVDGELVEYTLGPGQQMIVDTGNVLGFERTVAIDIQQVKGLKNKFFGGEGFFNTLLTGPGKVWLQTMPISNVARSMVPYMPVSSGN